MPNRSTPELVKQIAQQLLHHKARCASAESCTGGLIAATLTALPGSAQWFDCGLVTYSNTAKQQFLGVSSAILEQFGVVSAETVIAMSEGLLHRTGVDFTLAVSGIAGPSGGSLENPVGTIWFAWASKYHPTKSQCYHLNGTRTQIRKECVRIGLQQLHHLIAYVSESFPNF